MQKALSSLGKSLESIGIMALIVGIWVRGVSTTGGPESITLVVLIAVSWLVMSVGRRS
jgi:hypothetical protein